MEALHSNFKHHQKSLKESSGHQEGTVCSWLLLIFLRTNMQEDFQGIKDSLQFKEDWNHILVIDRLELSEKYLDTVRNFHMKYRAENHQ